MAKANPALSEKVRKVTGSREYLSAFETAGEIRDVYREQAAREGTPAWAEVLRSVVVGEVTPEIKVTSVLGETFVPPLPDAEQTTRSEEHAVASSESLQERQSRERAFLETRTDQLPKELDKVIDRVYDAIYEQEVVAISSAGGDGVAANNALVEAAIRKLTIYFAVEDYLAGKNGSKEQLERILRQNGVKVKLEDGKIKVPARITVALPPTETPTETQAKQALEQLQQIIEGKTTRSASAEDEFAAFAPVAVSNAVITNAVEDAPLPVLLERKDGVVAEGRKEEERLRLQGNTTKADALDRHLDNLERAETKPEIILRLQELNAFDHALFMRITEKSWNELYQQLKKVDDKVGEFSANDVDEIKKLLEQVRTSGEKGSELALEMLLTKYGMEDFEFGKAGGIPEEEEEKPKGKKK